MTITKVSFVLISFEQEDFIREAVRGAFAQDYENLEIVLSDDASSDSTFAIIEEEIAEYNGLHKVISNRNTTNLRVAHLDKAIAMASGDIFVIAHGDGISDPGRTRRLVDAMIENKVSVVSSNALVIDQENNALGLLSEVENAQAIPIEDIVSRPWEHIRHTATYACASEVFSRFVPIKPKKLLPDLIRFCRSAPVSSTECITWGRH